MKAKNVITVLKDTDSKSKSKVRKALSKNSMDFSTAKMYQDRNRRQFLFLVVWLFVHLIHQAIYTKEPERNAFPWFLPPRICCYFASLPIRYAPGYL